MDVKCPGASYPLALWACWVSTIAGLSRLFRDHNRLLACPDSRFMRRVLKRLVPANWWKGTANGRFAITVLNNNTGPLCIYRQLIPSKGLGSHNLSPHKKQMGSLSVAVLEWKTYALVLSWLCSISTLHRICNWELESHSPPSVPFHPLGHSRPGIQNPPFFSTRTPGPFLKAFAHRVGLGKLSTDPMPIHQACTHESITLPYSKSYPNKPLPLTNTNLAILGNSLLGFLPRNLCTRREGCR